MIGSLLVSLFIGDTNAIALSFIAGIATAIIAIVAGEAVRNKKEAK